MNLQLTPFVKAMQSMSLPVQSRQRVAAIAVGYACACTAALPSMEVTDPEDFFRTTHLPYVRRMVSFFNEGTVIDTALAQEFARNFWQMRYEAVHRCPRMDAIAGEFFASVFGAGKFFAPETRQFCNDNAKDINAVYQVACTLMAALATENATSVL